MARINNAITFGSGFNISAQAPIDSRMRVEYESDLTNAATWPADTAPLYNGLIVTVIETGDVWILKNVNNYTNTTSGTGWVKVGSNIDIKDLSDSTGLRDEWSNKQDALTPGEHISIDSGNTINVTGVLPDSTFIPNKTSDLINDIGYITTNDIIDDTNIYDDKTWSSVKISSEISTLAGTSNSDIEGKETEDFRFVSVLPESGISNEQVIIKGENTDTLYKFIENSGWTIQIPDANKLYFDTENEALYSYVTVEHQFAPISMINTIVVGSNLNTNETLKTIKTPGVYSVVQRLHHSTKGDYIKNWTLTVEGVDYEEYDRSDSIYQKLVNNYTIQKRTWSATRTSNDGWSSFSTYYAGEIKDSTTSKYYTWSSNKLNTIVTGITEEISSKQNVLVSGDGISIDSGNTISVIGKQDEISDLDEIRNGAALGATALQSFTETDPTVPSWAKQPTKPTYTAQEVGALPVNTVIIDDATVSSGTTYSSEKIIDLLDNIHPFRVEVVEILPESGETNVIYFVRISDWMFGDEFAATLSEKPKNAWGFGDNLDVVFAGEEDSDWNFGNNLDIIFSGENDNVMGEYMWINDKWELIGTSQVNLSNYYTMQETQLLLSGKQDKLIPGNNIVIDDKNHISAIDTTYEASDFDIKDLADTTGLRNNWNSKISSHVTNGVTDVIQIWKGTQTQYDELVSANTINEQTLYIIISE